ncbi:histone-lysine N-methyltransferase SETMAR [Plakobranchus ocellatus]|uniref:Histone-lysine N-methyltransferase SETMAR n=1 Tax=Plakobranchus ocellatus TaxID=259542 RepID=A0AAV4BYU4_9GAST|nr:histone-lysine N-methyltransferase SETMAR [Plakobranchus ocellatus]
MRYGWEILPHPAHSPDLALSDFNLFGPKKRHLGGMAFETEDDLISELRNWFDNLDVDFFRVGINSLLSRWCDHIKEDHVCKRDRLQKSQRSHIDEQMIGDGKTIIYIKPWVATKARFLSLSFTCRNGRKTGMKTNLFVISQKRGNTGKTAKLV